MDEARSLCGVLSVEDAPLLILGGGSNLLLTGDYPGTVLHSAIRGIRVEDGGTRSVWNAEAAKRSMMSLPLPWSMATMGRRTCPSFPERWERVPCRTSVRTVWRQRIS